jgi:uncharacterized protein
MFKSIRSFVSSGRTTASPVYQTAAARRSTVPWRHVALYSVLAFGLAWALWLALLPNFFDLLTGGAAPEKLDIAGIYVIGMYAPALAAVVMRLFVSKEGLKGSLGPVRKWRFYVLAVLLGAVVVNLVLAVDVLTGLGEFTWGREPALWIEYAALALNAVTFTAFATFGEEYGWRGYLLPKLIPLGEIKAAVIVGLIWGPWHLPLLIAGLNYPGAAPLVAIALFIPVTVALSLLHARVFIASGGAVLVATVLHGSFNAFGDTLAATEHLTGSPLVVSPGGVVGVVVILLIALVAYRASKARWPRGRSVTASVAASGRVG